MLEPKEIRDILRENVVEVVFLKKDGTERQMICTLMDKFLPSRGEEITTQTDKNSKTVTVWDLEADAWRSFCIERVIDFRAESVEEE